MAMKLYDKAVHAARYFLLRRLPPCKAMASLMSESLERALTVRERVTLKLHLWVCIWCVWYLEHLRVLRETIRARSDQFTEGAEDTISPDLALSVEAGERIKKALERSVQ